MPHTRAEEEALTQDIAQDLLGLFLGTIKRLMPENEALRLYMSLAGDDEAEQRRRIGAFCSQIEHKIDRKLARRRASIEECYRFALKATTTEERDTWNDKIRIHVAMIAELEDLRVSVLRLLAMAVPWPDIIKSALFGRRSGQANTQLVPASLERHIERLLSGTGATQEAGTAPAPPAPPESKEETKSETASRS